MVRAFTLLEMLVSVAIFGIISAVVLSNNSEFNNTVLLTNTAYDIGLSIRQAQSYGVSTRVQDNSFTSGYGVLFDGASSYKLFADLDADRVYDGEPTDKILSTNTLGNGYTIQQYCGVSSAGVSTCYTAPTFSSRTLIITFLRPDTDAVIKDSLGNIYSTAKITITRNGKIRVIYVTATGQISVKSS